VRLCPTLRPTFSDAKCELARFLGYVDLLGTTYTSSTVATGYGAYIAQPLLRKAVEGRENVLTEEEASRILEECMRILYYRDSRSLDKVCHLNFTPLRDLRISFSTKWLVSMQPARQSQSHAI
jgi:20S proteasome alpha/beta subunit